MGMLKVEAACGATLTGPRGLRVAWGRTTISRSGASEQWRGSRSRAPRGVPVKLSDPLALASDRRDPHFARRVSGLGQCSGMTTDLNFGERQR